MRAGRWSRTRRLSGEQHAGRHAARHPERILPRQSAMQRTVQAVPCEGAMSLRARSSACSIGLLHFRQRAATEKGGAAGSFEGTPRVWQRCESMCTGVHRICIGMYIRAAATAIPSNQGRTPEARPRDPCCMDVSEARQANVSFCMPGRSSVCIEPRKGFHDFLLIDRSI